MLTDRLRPPHPKRAGPMWPALISWCRQNDGAEQEFRTAIECDEGFALAHVGLARVHQV